MKIPQIGETVEVFFNDAWHIDWLTQKRFDYMIDKEHFVESGVLFWGNRKERFKYETWRNKCEI